MQWSTALGVLSHRLSMYLGVKPELFRRLLIRSIKLCIVNVMDDFRRLIAGEKKVSSLMQSILTISANCIFGNHRVSCTMQRRGSKAAVTSASLPIYREPTRRGSASSLQEAFGKIRSQEEPQYPLWRDTEIWCRAVIKVYLRIWHTWD